MCVRTRQSSQGYPDGDAPKRGEIAPTARCALSSRAHERTVTGSTMLEAVRALPPPERGQMFNLCNRMSSLSARPSKIGAVPGPAPPDKLGRATTQARPPAITTPKGRGRRPRPALVAGAGPGPPRRGNLTVPGGTVGSAAAAALLVGAVHPHPQLGAGTDRFRSPTSPATGRFIAVARTPRSTDSATRTGVDSRALAGHRRLRPSVLRSRRTLADAAVPASKANGRRSLAGAIGPR